VTLGVEDAECSGMMYSLTRIACFTPRGRCSVTARAHTNSSTHRTQRFLSSRPCLHRREFIWIAPDGQLNSDRMRWALCFMSGVWERAKLRKHCRSGIHAWIESKCCWEPHFVFGLYPPALLWRCQLPVAC
jgi:hypothetical protein